MIGERLRPSTRVKDWVNPSLIDITGFGIYWPRLLTQPTASSVTFSAANQKTALVFQAPKTGTIDRVGFTVGAFTTGATIDVRLETLDANGDPSGALVATNSNASYAVSAIGFQEVTLTAGAAVTKGDWIAVVLVNPAVSPANFTVNRLAADTTVSTYVDDYTGSWAKARGGVSGGLRYSDGSYPNMAHVVPLTATATATAFGSASTPDERGNKFTTPFACEVTGFWVTHVTDTDARTYRLYNKTDAVLATVTASGPFTQGSGIFDWLLPTPIRLGVGDVVRLTMRPGASTVAGYEMNCPSGMEAAMPGGTNVVYTSRSDDGAWTDLSTRFAVMGLILSKVGAA